MDSYVCEPPFQVSLAQNGVGQIPQKTSDQTNKETNKNNPCVPLFSWLVWLRHSQVIQTNRHRQKRSGLQNKKTWFIWRSPKHHPTGLFHKNIQKQQSNKMLGICWNVTCQWSSSLNVPTCSDCPFCSGLLDDKWCFHAMRVFHSYLSETSCYHTPWFWFRIWASYIHSPTFIFPLQININ